MHCAQRFMPKLHSTLFYILHSYKVFNGHFSMIHTRVTHTYSYLLLHSSFIQRNRNYYSPAYSYKEKGNQLAKKSLSALPTYFPLFWKVCELFIAHSLRLFFKN
uniref:Uncharacterized protein n=1 Tax=Cacopsylla melanoneura TaxID=428564 RepID=A0A8D8R264_9HEMI